MSDEEIKSETDIEDLSAETPTKMASEREGVGLRTVLLSSAVAAILGISGGTYFGGMAAQHSEPVLTDYSSDIDTAQKDLGKLTAKLERLERKVTQIENKEPTEPTGKAEAFDTAELDAKFEALSALEDRIAVMENRPSEPSLQLDTSGEAAEPAIYNSAIESRLESLEARPQVEIPEFDLTAVEARIAALENQVAELPIVLPAFPRDAVLKAIESAKSNEDKGWFARTFGGQVIVQDADILARIERIEEHVALQDVAAIQQDVASLPDSVQDVLGPWLAQVKKIGNSR